LTASNSISAASQGELATFIFLGTSGRSSKAFRHYKSGIALDIYWIFAGFFLDFDKAAALVDASPDFTNDGFSLTLWIFRIFDLFSDICWIAAKFNQRQRIFYELPNDRKSKHLLLQRVSDRGGGASFVGQG
jgi:hypothetical protein